MEGKMLTKIICTIGPESMSEERIQQLAEAGMSVARLNFSHGSVEDHLKVIGTIRKVRERLDRYVAIALDTKGPEVRISIPRDRHVLAGDILRFSTRPCGDDILMSPVGLQHLKVDDRVFVDDGLLSLRVVETGDSGFACEALNGHTVKNNKSVNFPGIDVGLRSPSERDMEDIVFGLDNGVDIVFASFVSSSSDVDEIRKRGGGRDVFVVSKIESLCAMRNLEEIVLASDGVMVARGDLGAEIGLENLFGAQKEIVSVCRRHRKPVICATQMMESMTSRSFPSRAEVSDVGNAVYEGCDCVMLSGETAVGLFPVETVGFMRMICLNAEEYSRKSRSSESQFNMLFSDVGSIVMFATNMSQIRPVYMADLMVPVVVVSEDEGLLGRLCIHRGIIPVLCCGTRDVADVVRMLGLGGRSLVIEDGQARIADISRQESNP